MRFMYNKLKPFPRQLVYHCHFYCFSKLLRIVRNVNTNSYCILEASKQSKQPTWYLHFSFILFDRDNSWIVPLFGINDTLGTADPRYIGDVIIRLKGHEEEAENQKWFGIGNLFFFSRYVYSCFKISIAVCQKQVDLY